jgi:4-hydroxy-3-methylbut-2-enyl diphosphate reductase
MTGLVVLSALRIEAAAVRRGIASAGSRVAVAGAGRRTHAPHCPAEAVAVAGTAGGLSADLKPGDVVVATEVRDDATGRVLSCPSAPFIAAALRAQGLSARLGPIVTTPGVVTKREERARLAATGALTVDTETLPLLAAAGSRPVAAVRVVVDTADAPLIHPGTIVRGIQALRMLSRIGPALEEWAGAAGPREVVLAEPRSFCAGVERAISTVERVLETATEPVFVRRQIVHNAHVVADLERRGAVFVTELDEVPERATVVLSAHGVAPSVRTEAAQRQLSVVDATCPLVSKVHAEARHAANRGDTVILVGHEGHEEVEGTVGEAPDRTIVVSTPEEVYALELPDPQRITWVTQTTLAVDETEEVVRALRDRFPEASGPASDDICYATSNRQQAVREIATKSDLVLVLGSTNSSNSKRLVEVAERCGVESYLIDDVGEVRPGWLVGKHRIGVTAGASAPPHLVDALVDALSGLGPVSSTTRGIGKEFVVFDLPKEVRR